MQVALTVWQGRISPLFDSTRKLLVAQIEENRIVATHLEAFDDENPLSRASRLEDLGVATLICGGISDDFAKFVEAMGIRIIPFTSGVVKQVLDAYLSGNLLKKWMVYMTDKFDQYLEHSGRFSRRRSARRQFGAGSPERGTRRLSAQTDKPKHQEQ